MTGPLDLPSLTPSPTCRVVWTTLRPMMAVLREVVEATRGFRGLRLGERGTVAGCE